MISVVFGAHNALSIVISQTALYAQAPGDPAGASAGMLRAFMYPGAIALASPIILSFGDAATDADLPRLAVILYSQRGRVSAQNRNPKPQVPLAIAGRAGGAPRHWRVPGCRSDRAAL